MTLKEQNIKDCYETLAKINGLKERNDKLFSEHLKRIFIIGADEKEVETLIALTKIYADLANCRADTIAILNTYGIFVLS